jgi:DNA-binding GntR family transcriptional regulator
MEDYWSDIHSQDDRWTPLSASALHVYRFIWKRIVRGEIKPGDRLLEVEIARAAGVSRSPVREAFMRLESDGIVASKPHRGTYVMPLSARRFQEIAEFRLGLEELAVRRLANCTNESLAKLRLHAMAAREDVPVPDFEAFVKADSLFHCSLLEHANLEPLLSAYMWLAKEFESYSRLMAGDAESIELLGKEHDELIGLICDRKTEAAVELLRIHLRRGYDLALARLH